MSVCKKCGEEFSKFEKINGKRMDSRRRLYCFKCNPFGSRNFYKGNLVHRVKEEKEKIIKKCIECGKEFKWTKNSVCSTCRGRHQRDDNRKIIYSSLENKCCICGYDKCEDALALHHIDPAIKELTFASSWGLAIETLKEEAKKCILLCCRCHAEVHAGITKAPFL